MNDYNEYRKMEEETNNYDNWEGGEDIGLLDEWFASETWSRVCEDAGGGDEDSIELMKSIEIHLKTLVFRIEGDKDWSHKNRVDYELRQLSTLIKNFQDEQ